MSEQQHPGFTASGRRKKPDKWANLLKAKNAEYYTLLHQVTKLEKEKTSLRAKEIMLLQVLDTFQALIAASDNPGEADHGSANHLVKAAGAAGAAAAAHNGPQSSLLDPMWLVWAVQQRENEISKMYGDLLNDLYPSHEQEMRGFELLKAMCSPSNVLQAGAMTCEELTTHLSSLAGRCALYLMQQSHVQPDTPAAHCSVSGPLLDAYMEFSTLIMTAMLWHGPTFRTVVNTNLDTQQPFEEMPPPQHWLDALEKLELTEEQLAVLVCLYELHFKAGRARLQEAINKNMRQQEANTEALRQLRQQQACEQQQLGSADASGQPTKECTEGSGLENQPAAAPGSSPPRPSKDLILQINALMESQEALAEEQSKILRLWLLLGVHVGIVCSCTLSTYQLAMFVVTAYPSIPRMDIAIAAYQAQQQQPAEGQIQPPPPPPQQQQKQQQQQQQRSSSGPGLQGSSSGPDSLPEVQLSCTSNKQDGLL